RVVRPVLPPPPVGRRHLRQRRRQRRLPVVHVPDRPDVHVRLRPLKFGLGHGRVAPVSCWVPGSGGVTVCGSGGRSLPTAPPAAPLPAYFCAFVMICSA